MSLSSPNGTFTGPLRIDVAVQYDAIGAGPSQPLIALGELGQAPSLILGQVGASNDLFFELSQGGTVYRLVADEALVSGETASFTAEIDENGIMALFKDDTLLGELLAEVPLSMHVEDLRGPATDSDPSIVDLTVEALSPTSSGGDMAVVAHPDDDLLFMNPTVAHTIAEGDPMTTVYLTSGDAGAEEAYWQAREMGAKAAYAQMAGADPASWVDETVTLDVDGEAVTVQSSYLADDPQVRLYFLRTPDGIDGGGTDTYEFGSLERLLDGETDQITTVDGQTTYTAEDLTATIGAIMVRHAPTDILLQDDSSDIEHSDHVHTTDIAESALSIYGENVNVTLFTSYNSWAEEENLSPEDTALVTSVFDTYAAFDPSVTDDAGAVREPYTDWLLREYVAEQYSIVDGERVEALLPEDEPEPIEPEPVEPESVDPEVIDPEPADPDPEEAVPGELGAFGPYGVFTQFLAGNLDKWTSVNQTEPDAAPTVPDPVEPAPADTTPVSGIDPFGSGGLYELLMISSAGKWEALDTIEEDDPTEVVELV